MDELKLMCSICKMLQEVEYGASFVDSHYELVEQQNIIKCWYMSHITCTYHFHAVFMFIV